MTADTPELIALLDEFVIKFIVIDSDGNLQTYKLIKLVGKGGSSKVFKAKDSHGDTYAVKVIRKDKNLSYEAS